MTRRITFTAAAIASAAAAAALMAGPAHAAACTGTNPDCTVSGTVTIPVSMTVSLDNTSFSLAASPGHGLSTGGTGTADPGTLPLGTVPSSYAVNATVSTNNAGYQLTESLGSGTGGTSGQTGFKGASSGKYLGDNNTTYAWSYPASDATIGAGGTFSQTWGADTGAGPLGSPVVNQAAASGASGDTWGLAWGWQIDGSATPDTYTGYVNVIGLA